MQRKHLMKLDTHFILLKKTVTTKGLNKIENQGNFLSNKGYLSNT